MANPAELTITYVAPNTRVDYPAADVIDEAGEIAIAPDEMEQFRLNLFALALESDASPQSVTIKAGDNPPAVRRALGDLVVNLDAVPASYETELAGGDNDLVFTAVTGGEYGDDISIAYVDAGADETLAVAVAGKAITVTLGTAAGGAIESTAADIMDAINEHDDASALVVATLAADNDGTGVVTAMAAKTLGTDGDAGASVTYLLGPLETARFVGADGAITLDFAVNEDAGGTIGVRVLEMPKAV